MIESFDIAGYCRISVDEELDRDNTSIENQKAIIEGFVRQRFPESTLEFYEDRDRSGYTFEQREGYKAMRCELISRKKDILVVKDFSRFSRRNSRGLVELEDLRDAGVRIISIGDNIDFPNDDDWLKIQFQFLINEMPVTDSSKKVKSVIRRRQEDGKWLCAAPYGYIINKQQQFEIVPTEADIVRKIFTLYNEGWGYKKIANHLTAEGIPTPRMSECQRREAQGGEYKREVKAAWSIATVQGILDNDFYIGTLRQGKYTRKKINGPQTKRDTDEHLVFENHHQPIIDYRTFATTMALREKRSRNNYRGIKINDNIYSGFLFCGDCGSPMFAMSRRDLKDAYRCGEYHKRGLSACTSHHIRVETLDKLIKDYVQKIRDNSEAMLERLNEDIKKESEDLAETEKAAENLVQIFEDLQEELKVTKRQRVRDIMKHPQQEQTLEEVYDELELDLVRKIEGLQNQLTMTQDKQNTIIRVNRAAKTAMEVFNDILNKPKLERNDLELIINFVKVYEDHLEIQLQSDIDSIIRRGKLPDREDAANFNLDIADSLQARIVQSAYRQADKVFDVSVINDGDPLEIFTEKDGEVIFKKYSPVGELSDFAAQICESLFKTGDCIAAVCDRDSVVACSGVPKKELADRRLSEELSDILEARKLYFAEGPPEIPFVYGNSSLYVCVAAPILSEGDLIGGVIFAAKKESAAPTEVQIKLASTVASFLGKQMES